MRGAARLILALCIATSACALAQIKSIPTAKPASAPAAAVSVDEQIAALQARLQTLRPRIDSLMSTAAGAPLPPGVTPEEWAEQRRLLHTGEIYLRNHLDALQKLKGAQRASEEVKAQSASWQQFAQAPANALQFVDDLWDRTRAKKREIEALRAEQALIDSLIREARTALAANQSALREATERLEGAAGAERLARARWLRELAELRATVSEWWLGMLGGEHDLKSQTLAWRSTELDLLQRMATTATREFPFSAQDRDARLATLAAQARGLDQEIERALAAESAARDRMEAARVAVQDARKASPQDPAAVVHLQDVFDARKAAADTAAVTLHLLRVYRQTVPLQEQMWHRRYALQQDGDLQHLRGGVADIARDRERLLRYRGYVQSELDTVRAMVDSLQPQMLEWNAERGDKSAAQDRLRAYIQRESLLRRIAGDIEALDNLLLNWRETLVLRDADATLGERLRSGAGDVTALAAKLWNLELLTVEDKIVIEGREIVGKRSVTVGKVIEVSLILVLGLWVTAKIAARGRRIALRRLAGRESTALLVHRVISLILSVCLIVFALVTASIPLAAFAFLGGALAIGVGFGAQNLLNNFISGVILLIEKPIKLGDVVDVEGVRGTVTDIGSRCCKVRRPDGVDMLIPNSSFLQQTVTNWTHSDQQSRFSIKVGAGYGSPTREVEALILRAMQDHPEVLKDPEPQVLFEDFGDNALAFTGNFWLNLVRHPRSAAVASDIRHRIDELFREHHIEVPFPQRDVHLDGTAPLQVEVAMRPVTRAERSPA